MAELDARRAEVLRNAAKIIQRQMRTYIARKDIFRYAKLPFSYKLAGELCQLASNLSTITARDEFRLRKQTKAAIYIQVGLKQGLEMLEIFKRYSAKTSLLDDLSFYGNREKMLKAKRISKAAFQTRNKRTRAEHGVPLV
ncbi:hypothetical protein L2E82_13610 [Cichorium intybus]|uniref:Uncharacterized protein n=1 Tax=Cichorium intybus TaxID=13427 RepID=A0ACB9EY43_CICIN|nr:hypothetical protein L2E82_13610 [Cichorium intybus]